MISMPEPQQAGDNTRVLNIIPLATLSDEEWSKLVASILVVIPCRAGEGINPGTAMHLPLWGRMGLKFAILKDPHGGFIEVVRGAMERMFLEMTDKNPEVRFLVMIDNDQAIEWDAPMRLAYHDKPIVSGVVAGYNSERGIFSCFTMPDAKGVPRFPSYRFTKMFPGKGLRKVHQVGTGLCSVRRDVFETINANGGCSFLIDEKMRKDSYKVGHIKQGEDFSFCDKARAAGFDIYVDFSIRALHYKTIPLAWPEDRLDDDLDASATDEEGKFKWMVSSLDFRGLMDQR